MQVTQLPGGSLLLTYDSTRWSTWLFGGALMLAATAAYDLTIGTRGDQRLVGLIGGFFTCVAGGFFMRETTHFHVDAFRREIEWRREWALQRRSGRIRFSDINHVAVERPIGDTGVPSRRIVLHLTNGELVPITVGYRPDAGDAINAAAQTLRELIGHQRVPPVDAAIRALLASGRKVDAIKLLVEEQQLSLSDAKARVDRVHEETRARA